MQKDLGKRGKSFGESAWYVKNIGTIKYSGRQKAVDWVRINLDIGLLGNINVWREGHWMNSFLAWGTSTFMSSKNMNVFMEITELCNLVDLELVN